MPVVVGVMIVSAMVLAGVMLAIWVFARRTRRPVRRWELVSDGSGHFSFYDGAGYLYPVDYDSLNKAAAEMLRVMASAPPALDENWRKSEAREDRYSNSSALSAHDLQDVSDT